MIAKKGMGSGSAESKAASNWNFYHRQPLLAGILPTAPRRRLFAVAASSYTKGSLINCCNHQCALHYLQLLVY
jgi:hypothetical protein